MKELMNEFQRIRETVREVNSDIDKALKDSDQKFKEIFEAILDLQRCQYEGFLREILKEDGSDPLAMQRVKDKIMVFLAELDANP